MTKIEHAWLIFTSSSIPYF